MKPESVIQAILFDVGWTLIYPKPTRKEASEDYLRVLGYSISTDDLSAANGAAVNFYRSHRWQPEAIANIAQFWQEYYTIFVEYLQIDDASLPEAFFTYVNKAIKFHLYPESVSVLQELRRRGYSIGAVSNWSAGLLDILENLGVTDCLDLIVVSDIVGYHKPQPEIFRYALNSLGVLPDATVHIGDDFEADVEGARRVGIRPIWLDLGASGNSDQAYRIQSLDELLSITIIG
jgi:HAD superfamily hydrolase (TIGR01549 family)